MRLSELQTGQKAYIKKVHGSGAFRKRILEMGFVRGEEVKSILNAPLKDPIKYEIMDYDVSLRGALRIDFTSSPRTNPISRIRFLNAPLPCTFLMYAFCPVCSSDKRI